jgi:hypothetical protein
VELLLGSSCCKVVQIRWLRKASSSHWFRQLYHTSYEVDTCRGRESVILHELLSTATSNLSLRNPLVDNSSLVFLPVVIDIYFEALLLRRPTWRITGQSTTALPLRSLSISGNLERRDGLLPQARSSNKFIFMPNEQQSTSRLHARAFRKATIFQSRISTPRSSPYCEPKTEAEAVTNTPTVAYGPFINQSIFV